MTMKFAYFGTPYVARDTLAILCAHGFIPTVVVTNPDAPRGRHHVLTPSETNEWARAHNIPVVTPPTLDAEALEAITSCACEYAIVVAYGKILPREFISSFPRGVLNIHYSLLPKYRGASPVEAALLHGDTVTGVTIQTMTYELDAGDIVAQKEVRIAPDDTTATLRDRLIAEGAALLIETLPKYLDGTITPTPQDHTAATFATKIRKEEGRITLDAPAEENWNKYRAYAMWPGTFFYARQNDQNIRVKITSATLTQDGKFKILRVVPEGKSEMDYEAFASGRNGEVL